LFYLTRATSTRNEAEYIISWSNDGLTCASICTAGAKVVSANLSTQQGEEVAASVALHLGSRSLLYLVCKEVFKSVFFCDLGSRKPVWRLPYNQRNSE
jgi:hypothetical protein